MSWRILPDEAALADEAGQAPALRFPRRERGKPRVGFLAGVLGGASPRGLGFELGILALKLAGQPADLEVCLDAADDFVGLKRFQDVIDRADPKAIHHAGRFLFRGDEQHGDFARGVLGLQLAADGKSVAARHDHIEQDQVRERLRGDLEPGFAPGRGQDFVAARLQGRG